MKSKGLKAWRLKNRIQSDMLKLRRLMQKIGGQSFSTDYALARRHDSLQRRMEIVKKYLFI